ncbi:hypothetical protein EIP91_001956 [Steccherinum ochraceum]|uniref:Uncharacterized protein n=1 Tax=Steccherinum ochraceum TaxID=92696 RepID=A0A4R0RTS0_9APHY|nr:hypothetical protein EIP91_001956 [Steccherinum ochraceum]
MPSLSSDEDTSSRIPFHLKGKAKASDPDETDNTASDSLDDLLRPAHDTAKDASWRSSVTTAASSRPSLAVSAAPLNEQPVADPEVSTVQVEANPTTVHRTWGGTPMVGSTLYLGDIPIKWCHHVHLNGTFYNVLVSNDLVPHAITPADIKDPVILRKFDDAVQSNQLALRKIGVTVPGPYLNGWEVLVVRDLDSPDGPTVFYLCYERCLYIEPCPRAHLDKDILIEHKTERFWSEVEKYPMHLSQLPFHAEVEFLGALSFGANERITEWDETPFPFTDYQAQRLMKVYRSLKKELDRGNRAVVPAMAWHIARTMVKIENVRRQTKFGTAQNELYRPVVPKQPTRLVKIAEILLMVFLFGAHKMYRVRLQHARVQGTIYLSDFRDVLGNFLAEWSDSNLLATVFIGANIAFLAVPDITNLQRNASLASVVCSLTSVLTGVHHVWQHRTKVNANFEEANAYLSHIQPLDDGGDSDLAITACFLSIPLVALLYAVLSFSVAIAAYCIQNNDVHGKILLVVVLGILGIAGLVTLLFFWHVWRGPRDVEISAEQTEDVLGYGWKSRAKGLRERAGILLKKRHARRTDSPPSEDEEKGGGGGKAGI